MATKKKKKVSKNLNVQNKQKKSKGKREIHKSLPKKFRRNIFIGVIALFIVAFIINTAPGFKKDKYKDITNLVISDENVTDELTHKIYINEKGTIYLAKDDLSKLLNKTIYYDESENTIIITSESTVASMRIGEKSLKINGANLATLDTIIEIENIMYIPISELESVYNISVKYIEKSNIIVIDDLSKTLATAETNEKVNLKFRPRGLSKTLTKLDKNERVYAFETTKKGWRLIRTEDGAVGYIKAKYLSNEYTLRQDMESKESTVKNVKVNLQTEDLQDIGNIKVSIQDLFEVQNTEIILKKTTTAEKNENQNVWATLSINENEELKNYKNRSNIIDNLIKVVYKYKIKGINVKLELNKEENDRFLLELAPRLKEMGIITNLITNEKIDKEKYKGIIEYIITNE